MNRIIRTYEKSVLERRTVTWEVREDDWAEVSAWHGGRMLTSLATLTSLREAIREAERHVKRFGVGKASSLEIRVDHRTEHVHAPSDRRDSDREIRTLMARRHVWDAHRGVLDVQSRAASFTRDIFIGFEADAEPVGSELALITQGVTPRCSSEEIFHSGMGFAGFTWKGVAMLDDARSEALAKHPGPVRRFRVSGTLLLLTPQGIIEVEAYRFLETIDIVVQFDFRVLPGTTSWRIYTDIPETKTVWSLETLMIGDRSAD